MHDRTRVRLAMAAVLTAGVPSVADDHIHTHRSARLNARALPAIRIYIPAQQIIPRQTMMGDHSSRLTVRVEVLVRGDDQEVEQAVDDICAEVEAAIEANPTLSGACRFCQLESTEIDFEDEERTMMMAALDFEAVL